MARLETPSDLANLVFNTTKGLVISLNLLTIFKKQNCSLQSERYQKVALSSALLKLGISRT